MMVNATIAFLGQRRCPRLIGLTAWLLVLVLSGSAEATLPAEVVAAVKHNIETRYPGTEVLDVQATPMAGVYELFDGEQLIYTDARGDYLLMGPLIDTQAHHNLSSMSMEQRDRIDFRSLPLERAIRVVKGKGRREFAVFTDPDCPFCQQLEKSLLTLDDVTMYVFLYPITALHPDAAVRAHAIWCSRERSKAWELWMQDRVQPAAPGACKHDPLEQLAKLAAQLRINSTPTLFLSDGRRIRGAVKSDELNVLLEEAASVAKSGAATAAAAAN